MGVSDGHVLVPGPESRVVPDDHVLVPGPESRVVPDDHVLAVRQEARLEKREARLEYQCSVFLWLHICLFCFRLTI
jgi:hypothetical protein